MGSKLLPKTWRGHQFTSSSIQLCVRNICCAYLNFSFDSRCVVQLHAALAAAFFTLLCQAFSEEQSACVRRESAMHSNRVLLLKFDNDIAQRRSHTHPSLPASLVEDVRSRVPWLLLFSRACTWNSSTSSSSALMTRRRFLRVRCPGDSASGAVCILETALDAIWIRKRERFVM